MEDITLFLWAGSMAVLIIQFYVRQLAVYFLGDLLGIGGLVSTINEVTNETLATNIGLVMTIAMVIVILYSTMAIMFSVWPDKRGRI